MKFRTVECDTCGNLVRSAAGQFGDKPPVCYSCMEDDQ